MVETPRRTGPAVGLAEPVGAADGEPVGAADGEPVGAADGDGMKKLGGQVHMA